MSELVPTDTLLTPDEVASAPISEPRWSGLRAALSTLWQPATTARRTQHLPLLNAFGVHLLAAILGSIVLFLLAVWEDSGGTPGRAFALRLEYWVDGLVSECFRELDRHPLEFLAACIGIVLLIEAGFVALGLLLAPWGAADERLRATAANGIRHVWLHTADAVPIFLLVGLIVVPLFHVRRDWWNRSNAALTYPVMPTPPSPPTNARVGSKEWREYTQRQKEYTQQLEAYSQHWQQARREREARQPWLVKYGEYFVGGTFFATGIWVLWAMTRAVGAARLVTPIVRPPMCEHCGYNLTTMPMDARCPECGTLVRESLGPGVRPGAIWERRREIGFPRAWWQMTLAAIAWPAWLGTRLRVSRRTTDHRVFMAVWYPVAFAIGYGMMVCMMWRDMARSMYINPVEVFCAAGPVVGVLVATVILIAPLLGVALIGTGLSVMHRRNLLPAAMQAAAYTSGLLALSLLLSAATAVATFYMNEAHIFREFEVWLRIDDDVLAFFTWMVPSTALAIIYLVWLYKGTRGAIHANT